ncbi:CDP-alcohol phosphatidyltransferase family protein [Burkholderia sp. BCC0322]|uniref:CDP-alcohol phosphatidyltransferase family protein n=1 Tax=unclassified Burkholderia TaxID=2613784 RepID=UPI00158E93CB|nr:CDP-alcohol phosphatidyltransferase family protein [Burkholderia sp. BCC0322]
MKHIPLLLTALRAALAPVLLLLAVFAPNNSAFALCLVAAFLSDVFDGVIARRLGVATPNLRRLDSISDSLFYIAATFAVWYLHPYAVIDRWVPLALLVALELCRYAFDFIKFKREASYHMWSSKLWGIALFAGFFSLLALGSNNVLVDVAIYLGIIADIEGLAISVILRQWKSDVPSFVHAFQLRASGRT